MSKQQGYQQLSTEHAPGGEHYGFAARVAQAGHGSYQTDDKASSSSSSAAGVPPSMAYASAPVTGYPVMTPAMAGGMAGPVGLGLQDPLGRRDRKRARKQAKRMAGGRRRPPLAGVAVGLLVGGPVTLLVGLVRHAIHIGKEHLGKQSPAPADHPGSSNEKPVSQPKP